MEKSLIVRGKYLATVLMVSIILAGCGGQSSGDSKITDSSEKEKAIEVATNIKSREQSKVEDSSNKEELDIVNLTSEQEAILSEAMEKIEIPAGYQLFSIREEVQEKENVLVFRYTKSNKEELGGEHFSFTVRKRDGLILGTTWMDRIFEKGARLPNKEETKKYAKECLDIVEPTLFDKINNLWIDEHDETIIVDGKEIVLTGMKYKCYIPDEGTYVWVIVGESGTIITYERGIVWNNEMSNRVSEMWLHDSWVKNR